MLGMRLTIRTEGAEAAGSLRAALDEAGDFELSEVGETSVGVVASAGAAAEGAAHADPTGHEAAGHEAAQAGAAEREEQ